MELYMIMKIPLVVTGKIYHYGDKVLRKWLRSIGKCEILYHFGFCYFILDSSGNSPTSCT